MSNEPDAYTLAAMAAADRARASAEQGASPAMPANPIRKLMRLPGARWVLSSIVLAVAVGLAVDYLNTGLKARLQYEVKIPGINGGKSVAEDAAEVSAKPQADIETNITAPAQSESRTDALKKSDAEKEIRVLIGISERAADTRLGNPEIRIYRLTPVFRRHLEEYNDYLPWDTDQLGDDEKFMADPLVPMPRMSLAPLVFKDHTPATINDRSCTPAVCKNTTWMFVKFADGSEAIVRKADFDRLTVASRRLEVAAQPPVDARPQAQDPIKDLGAAGFGDTQVALRGSVIYRRLPEGTWQETVFNDCQDKTAASAPKSPSTQHTFLCTAANNGSGGGYQFRFHAAVAPAG